MSAQILSLTQPRASAREQISLDHFDLPTARDTIRQLQSQVAREMNGLPVTDRNIYITYEEVAACPTPSTSQPPEPSPSPPATA